jgi:hypothetical protein
MSRFTVLASTCLCLLVAAGCGPSISVEHDWDTRADFTDFKRFKLMESNAVGDQLIQRRIDDSIRLNLTEFGLVEDQENPDFLIATHANVQDRVDVQTWGYGMSSRHWHGTQNVSVSNYQVGTLVIDFVDARTNELAWRGWGSKTLSSSSRDPETIQEAVDRILNQFPPQ